MNILVCVKQVQSTYARTGTAPETHYLNPEDSIFRVNPYDEAAMALAVKVKAALPETVITIVTLAPMNAEEDLWRLMGMGADRLCRIDLIDADTAQSLDSRAKAQVLARAARVLEAELVLCGKESVDRANGLVPAYMAQLLQLPFASGILDLKIESMGVRITQNAGKGRREILDCRLPALFSVALVPGPLPMPAYAAIQLARRKEILHILPDPGGLTIKTRCTDTHPPRPRTKPVLAPDSLLPSFERVKRLLAGSTIHKKGKMVSGPAENQVNEIVAYLQRHALLPQNPSGHSASKAAAGLTD